MKARLQHATLKKCLWISPLLLLAVIVFNFYGLYSDKFYFLKFDNYIFPILTIVHFLYLYVIWYKIKERELPDPQMRNVEFAMYVILVVYIFKFIDNSLVVLSYLDYKDYIIPETFLPMGILIIMLQLLLIGITLFTFLKRKEVIGRYRFDNFNENADSWQDQF